MKIENCKNWEDFNNKVKERINKIARESKKKRGYYSKPIFRGHANFKDEKQRRKLQTTLERQLDSNGFRGCIKIVDYHKLIKIVKPQFESISNKLWELPKKLKNPDTPPFNIFDTKTLEFMLYLRHIGFPSPLLDWTSSPHIAAFFAFKELYCVKDKNNREAEIYMFVEYKGEGKEGSLGGAPNEWEKRMVLSTIGPNIRTHSRHHLQQAEYTYCVCAEKAKNIDSYCYASYEDFFKKQNSTKQDELVKYTIPSSECKKVIDILKQMNINSYSLFNNEESLAEKLAMENLDMVF